MDYVCSADIGIHIMENTCLNHDYALPNKVFEYTMAGLPVIVSNLKEMAHFVRANKIGIVLEENTSEGLLKILDNIDEHISPNIKDYLDKAAKIYNWESQEKVLYRSYKKLSSL